MQYKSILAAFSCSPILFPMPFPQKQQQCVNIAPQKKKHSKHCPVSVEIVSGKLKKSVGSSIIRKYFM